MGIAEPRFTHAAGQPPSHLRLQIHAQWQQQAARHGGLWIFGYGSLIWRPDLDFSQRLSARVFGWHRALAMWSRVNRGTPERPGLVFAMLPGGSCSGVAYRLRPTDLDTAFDQLWAREMPSEVYDPRWLRCNTPSGSVTALAFTLSRRSPAFTGRLQPAQYQDIFCHSCGRYGTTLDYARETMNSLRANGIQDRRLEALLRHADAH